MLPNECLQVFGVNIPILPIVYFIKRLLVIELLVALKKLLLGLENSVEMNFHLKQSC